ADRVNTFGTAMLGLTVGCCRCHDHKFDPLTQRDYYSLFAYFNNLDEAGMYSHFTRATPTPTLWLWTPEQEAQHIALTNQIAAAEANLASLARASSNDFSAWLKTAEIKTPAPIAHFKFDEITSNTTPDSVSPGVAKLEDDVHLVPGAPNSDSAHSKSPNQHAGSETGAPTNFAVQFSGDSEAVCKGVKEFHRTDEFSFSLWLKPTEPQDRAIILHQSKAREDAGSRGFELTLDHERPFFGLMHFWPGNAVAVRAKDALPINEWSHLVVTYDGSSRAAGIKIFLNGTPLETETIRDQLTKDIVHRAEWGDLEPGKIHLTLAARFRDSGFKNGIMDDLQVFDTALTEPEVQSLGAPGTAPASSSTTLSTTDMHDSTKTQGAVLPRPPRGRGPG
ncbi:MAG TPA: LamG-like jellyroll fold domain-containing protein, partial [Candidatus Acidoferrales bacterium]|nr:LamG-like jellyroll fold domain-containing protein [Candidatus Acidoferrales bacterium]